MRDIYRKASHLVLWLGAGREYAARAVSALRCLAGITLKCLWRGGSDQKLVEKAVDTLIPDDWSAVANLLEEQYWRRLWIIQEILVSVARNAASL